ncbi:MAG: LCP family protein [Mycobacteriaceae bacterium]
MPPRPSRESVPVIHRDPTFRPPPPRDTPRIPPRAPMPPRQARSVPPPSRPAPPPRQPAVKKSTEPPQPPRRSRATASKRPRWGRRIILSTFTFGLVIVVAMLTTTIWIDSSLRRIAVFSEYTDRPPAANGTNWLLVGSDSREDLSPQQQAELSTGGDLGSSRTDTILLVHIPHVGSSQPATMVSIPRDSYVDIPGYGSDKINAAFAEGGPALLAETVELATGIRLDHYAEIGFGGFGAIVDALGGIEVCPPEAITDPLAGIDLPAGCQTLDGRNALGYVRSRATPRADLDRMLHQREFMSAMLRRAAGPAVWLNPWRWYRVPHAAVAALAVDQDAHVWNLALLGWALHGSPTTLTVPIGEFTGNDSGSVLIWDAESATALFDALRTDAAIPQQVIDAQP